MKKHQESISSIYLKWWLKYFNTFESLFRQQNEDYKINLIQKILFGERLIDPSKSNHKEKSGKRAQKQPSEVFYKKGLL